MTKIDIEKLLDMSCEFKQDEPFLEEAGIKTVESLWKGIDFDGMPPRRLRNIYNEYKNKLKSAAFSNTYSEFITNMCSPDGGMDIKSLPKIENRLIAGIEEELVKRKLQNDFLEYVVGNYGTLVIKLRAKKDLENEDKEQCQLV
ncbi:MAG: hypothetical protein A4E26_00127 [Methanobacterium sp. PtaU1.Bin097]|nr:MAG: hypothetical protein A4E26_00127 [Methanobacterium sp. PtaU1.Bin097]